jgi:RimJ/RimL family protein N-acetyltransferase
MPKNQIRLREVRESDLPLLFEWINDRDTRILSSPFRPVNWLQHKKWMSEILLDKKNIFFIISLDEAPIGAINVTSISADNKSAEFSIRIGDPHQRGQGYGTTAVKLLTDFCWKDLGLHRLSLSVLSDNLSAIRSYEKAGFKIEGQLVDAVFIDGQWKNLVQMGLINPNDVKVT